MRNLFFLLVITTFALCAAAQPYTIQQYLNIKSATAPAFSPDGKHLAYLTNVTGTSQVWMIDLPNGKPRQLTDYDDNISFVQWVGEGNGLVFGKARGGDENTQFFGMKPDGSGVKALTNDPTVRHNFDLVSAIGDHLYYSSNKRNRNYFDIYSLDLMTGKEDLLYQQDGNNNVAAVNGSGSKIIISRDGIDLSLDNDLYLVDTTTKAETLLTPHTGASEFNNPHFVADGIVFAHNENREFIGLGELRKKNAAQDDWSAKNRESVMLDDTKWDVDNIALNVYGNVMAYTVNREGVSELYLRKYETDGKPLITSISKTAESVWVPPQGIVSGLSFNHDQSKLAYAFESANHNPDIWVYDLKTKISTQLTRSDLAGVSDGTFISPKLIKYRSFDGREISAWFYEPPGRTNITTSAGKGNRKESAVVMEPIPVIVSVHGGPESQERPGFKELYQYYLSRGYAILATNVRGSIGYGKTFTHLDDVKNREDSVKDLAYSVDWLKTTGGADPKRIAVMGGSYGGYMTMAAVTLYPDIWAAAVTMRGIGNWETFLKTTSGYRRRQREVEYGRLDRDLDFLRSISPIFKVDKIKCPLFVVHGKNDPRVSITEAEQVVAAVKKQGGIVEYRFFDDEGHGVAKLKNKLELYPLVADFLDKNMKK